MRLTLRTSSRRDGQVTAQSGIALGMFAADCLPVLLGDPVTGIIGAAHCGRRGLERGVIGATVDLMKSKGADPANIVSHTRPAICGDCYEVGDEIADQFIKLPADQDEDPFRRCRHRHRRSRDDRPRFRRCNQVVDSMPRVHAATQYLEEDPELAELCRTDGEGLPRLMGAHRQHQPQHVHARKPTVVLAPPRRLANKNTRRPPPRPHRCVTKRRMRAHSVEDVMQFTDGQPSPYGGAYD